ncbi:phage major capsid protein [Acetobacter senegalensis]|uniref:phage major capsid protein n=1 Tax=Acetobacter senegalensis TaxID=446692 RepID=UPI0026561551|nr:phage major capsid protein [Acetobacter senegalensis]MDN7356329.1 phage major capsid protein [Acetobacter senegalensis]
MAIVSNVRLRQVLTTAMEDRSRAIQDLVFNSNPVLRILRENDRFKEYEGADIRVPLMIDKMDGQWFTGYDKLSNTPKELINSAVFTPKNVAVGFSLTGTELLANEGRGKIIDLLDTYMENAESSMQNVMEEAIHGDGTGAGGREMIGFGGAIPIVPNVGVYGGIDRSQVAMWRTSYYTATTDFPDIGTTFDVTTCIPMLQTIIANRSKGNRYADLIICDTKSYLTYNRALTAIQRITDARSATSGFDALSISTPAGVVKLLCANGVGTVMPENTVYGIDSQALEIRYHPSRNMVPLFDGDGARPINQDAIVQYLVWNGEMVLNNPRYTWRFNTTPAAA